MPQLRLWVHCMMDRVHHMIDGVQPNSATLTHQATSRSPALLHIRVNTRLRRIIGTKLYNRPFDLNLDLLEVFSRKKTSRKGPFLALFPKFCSYCPNFAAYFWCPVNPLAPFFVKER